MIRTRERWSDSHVQAEHERQEQVSTARAARAAEALRERAQLREQHAPLKRCVSVRSCAGVRTCAGSPDVTDGFWRGCADHSRSPYGMQHGHEQRLLVRLLERSGLLDAAAQAARAR
jgi:hypothetical protein